MNSKINKQTQFIHLGIIDYQLAWDLQENVFKKTVDLKISNRKVDDKSQELTPNYLMFCQHPHVYTLGKSGDHNNLLLNDDQLKEKGASYYKINRGGDITYHGPGQIVGYPILDLDHYFTDIHKYLRYLEEVVIKTLAEYGLTAGRSDGETGVWLDAGTPLARKICAMGVKASRWTTMHGFALNINTSLKHFGLIVPCGISDKPVTSLHLELGREVNLEEVKDHLKKHFVDQFGCALVPTTTPYTHENS